MADDKLQVVADVLEVELSEISEDSVLEEFETWDSVPVLSMISVISERTGHFLHADEFRSVHTVKDLLKLME